MVGALQRAAVPSSFSAQPPLRSAAGEHLLGRLAVTKMQVLCSGGSGGGRRLAPPGCTQAQGPCGGAGRDRGGEEGVPAFMSAPSAPGKQRDSQCGPEMFPLRRPRCSVAAAASSGRLKQGPSLTAFTCRVPFLCPPSGRGV